MYEKANSSFVRELAFSLFRNDECCAGLAKVPAPGANSEYRVSSADPPGSFEARRAPRFFVY